jgi:hypothetical protein
LAVSTLPFLWDLVVEVAADGQTTGGELSVSLQDQMEELFSTEAEMDVTQDIELVGDDDIRVGVQQRTDQAVPTARVANEETESGDVAILLAP